MPPRRATSGRRPAATPQSFDQRLLALDVRAVWRATRVAPWSLWFLCLYLAVEYARIQQAWAPLEVIPWGQLTILACLGATLLEGSGRRKVYAMDVLVAAFFVWVVVSGISAVDPAGLRRRSRPG